ncbi:DGQHR domain-containing protein [Microbacterium sp.]|uniref:DGQHR domain-containing protein n=1 Tax=Microbacterium sp. TaxID=51671 RepID=UPI003A921F15
MEAPKRTTIPALRVRQWLDAWEDVKFDPSVHRRRPSEHFYVTSIKASQLRALCDIHRRSSAHKGSRKSDLGVQRRHNEARSLEIAEFVKHGFPWSAISQSSRKSGEFDDLKKPGWLPTAIVVNVLISDDVREGGAVAPEDLVDVVDDGEIARLVLPEGVSPTWQPKKTAPIEVIDGQHRLWAFDESEDEDFELPVVLFHGLDISWQAYLFYVINIKPAKINTSLGFDLYPLLRTEDWLEHAGGPTIYRESRAQELTEALWSYPESPWYQRIDMLGDGGRRFVTQAAWIRSLLATFVKKWESTRVPIGGLYGAPAGKDKAVLPWNRSQQSAFLIAAWSYVKDAIKETDAEWAEALREGRLDLAPDPAFEGPTTLPNTDQGVRAILAVFNDLCFVQADTLELKSWPANDFSEGTSEIGIRESLQALRKRSEIDGFLRAVARGLATYDWRTYGSDTLTAVEKSAKARFRGSTGYRELREDVLRHLASSAEQNVSDSAREVINQLGWD